MESNIEDNNRSDLSKEKRLEVRNSRSDQNFKASVGARSRRHSSESLPDIRAISRSSSDQKIWSSVVGVHNFALLSHTYISLETQESCKCK